MTVEFALDYIRRRMKELKFGCNYIIRWRHFQLGKSETLTIPANNEFFLLINPNTNVAVRSKMGVYDINDDTINEMQYEHKGKIEIKNKATENQFILFIQVIPNHH